MISYIKGELTGIWEDRIVLENHGIGYEIRMPMSVLQQLGVPGGQVQVYTYLYVREDAISLYGFLSREDLLVFQLLLGVSGVGPKGALGILSEIPLDQLRYAVAAEDAKAITKAPGIGLKTARKLIIELKDKLKLEDVYTDSVAEVTGTTAGNQDAAGDAVLALEALGYSSADALKAVRKVEVQPDMDVEEILKRALKFMV